MFHLIRDKIRRAAASAGVVAASVFVTVPLDDCEGTLDVLLQKPEPATPVIPLPPPGNCDDGGDATPVPFPIP